MSQEKGRDRGLGRLQFSAKLYGTALSQLRPLHPTQAMTMAMKNQARTMNSQKPFPTGMSRHRRVLLKFLRCTQGTRKLNRRLASCRGKMPSPIPIANPKTSMRHANGMNGLQGKDFQSRRPRKNRFRFY